MTLPLRTLTNAGDPLCTPDGQVLSGVHVSFQLVDRYGVETDVWDALTHERVGGEPIVATTNEDGEFSVDLWPNSRGNRPTRYRCTVDHSAFKAFIGTVDDLSLDPLQWVEFMAASATIAPQDLGEMSLYRQELAAGLQTLGTAVEASSDSAEAAAGSATAAGASASQAASQAAAASASATAAAGSATSASTKAGEASASAGSAAGSASAAAASQSAAAASAATASTQAGAAADSAGQSASSASTASTQAGVASTQAGQAATSATLAQQWATRTDAEVVAGQGYGAMKYALDAAGSASAASSAASAAAATAAGLQTALDGKVDASDPRLSDAREWTAGTVDQPEAEAGTATSRRAWTAQRVRQAMLGWWGGFADKATPIDADSIVIADSAASNAPKRLSWANAVAKLRGTFVEGPASSVDGQVMVFDGATGKKAKSGGTPKDFILSAAGAEITAGISAIDMFSYSDVLTDKLAPFFVETFQFTKSTKYGSGYLESVVVSKDGPNTITVESGHGGQYPKKSAIVIEYDDGSIYSYAVTDQTNDAVTVFEPLWDNPIKAQPMFDGALSQHLSRLAYKGLAQYIVRLSQKEAYRKAVIWSFHAPNHRPRTYNDPNIYDLSGTVKQISVTALNGAIGGGYVYGTSNLVKSCSMTTGQENIGVSPACQYLGYSYKIVDAVAGRGVEISFPLKGLPGVLHIPVSADSVSYTSSVDASSQLTNGIGRLEVEFDGVNVLDVNVPVGGLTNAAINFSNVAMCKVRLTLLGNVPTYLRIGGIYAFAKSMRTNDDTLFPHDSVIAFFGDSWTQHPLAGIGETRPTRADGSTADGMCFLSEHMREYLVGSGVRASVLNMGKGGMTSEWGVYWKDKIAALSPKPTHCVINFGLNDANSVSSSSTAWDFDPGNVWATLARTSGGIDGRMTAQKWLENIGLLSDYLIAAGIKPIILMPPHTSSDSSAYVIRKEFTEPLIGSWL